MSRRRVRCPTGRTCGRWRLKMMMAGEINDSGNEPPSPAMPEHPEIFRDCGFYCMRRIVPLRSERYKSRNQAGTLNAREFARRGNCALGAQPANPRAPPEHRTSPPIGQRSCRGSYRESSRQRAVGHAAPPAAGGKSCNAATSCIAVISHVRVGPAEADSRAPSCASR